MITEGNWLQTQEGNVNSTHSAFLHNRAGNRSFVTQFRTQNNPPRFDIEQTRWGVRAIVRYDAGDNRTLIRTNTFIMPVWTALPNGPTLDDGRLDGFNVNTEVPIDDYNTMRIFVSVQRSQKLERSYVSNFADLVTADGHKVLNRSNDYRIDREKQRTKEIYSGIEGGAPFQDAAMTES